MQVLGKNKHKSLGWPSENLKLLNVGNRLNIEGFARAL